MTEDALFVAIDALKEQMRRVERKLDENEAVKSRVAVLEDASRRYEVDHVRHNERASDLEEVQVNTGRHADAMTLEFRSKNAELGSAVDLCMSALGALETKLGLRHESSEAGIAEINARDRRRWSSLKWGVGTVVAATAAALVKAVFDWIKIHLN